LLLAVAFYHTLSNLGGRIRFVIQERDGFDARTSLFEQSGRDRFVGENDFESRGLRNQMRDPKVVDSQVADWY